MIDASLRVSDEDRRRVVVALQGHTAAGRLSLDEFSDRVDLVYCATTHDGLSAVMRDLPVERHHAAGEPQRQLLLAFLVAGIAVVALGILLVLGR